MPVPTFPENLSLIPSTVPYANEINSSANQYGVPPYILAGLLKTESGFNPSITHANPHSIDRGIAQINSVANAQVTNAQAYNPTFAINWAAQHLASLKQSLGSWTLAVGAYNAGESAVKNAGGVPSYSQGYVNSVFANGTAYLPGGAATTSSGGTGTGSTGSTGGSSSGTGLETYLLNNAQNAGGLSWLNPASILSGVFGIILAVFLIYAGVKSAQGQPIKETVSNVKDTAQKAKEKVVEGLLL